MFDGFSDRCSIGVLIYIRFVSDGFRLMFDSCSTHDQWIIYRQRLDIDAQPPGGGVIPPPGGGGITVV